MQFLCIQQTVISLLGSPINIYFMAWVLLAFSVRSNPTERRMVYLLSKPFISKVFLAIHFLLEHWGFLSYLRIFNLPLHKANTMNETSTFGLRYFLQWLCKILVLSENCSSGLKTVPYILTSHWACIYFQLELHIASLLNGAAFEAWLTRVNPLYFLSECFQTLTIYIK